MSTTIQTYLSGGGGGLLFPRIIASSSKSLPANSNTQIYTATEDCWFESAYTSGMTYYIWLNNSGSSDLSSANFTANNSGFSIVYSTTAQLTSLRHFPEDLSTHNSSSVVNYCVGRFYLAAGEYVVVQPNSNGNIWYVAYTYKEAS